MGSGAPGAVPAGRRAARGVCVAGAILLAVGCTHDNAAEPCAATADCGAGSVCVDGLCRAIDPAGPDTGALPDTGAPPDTDAGAPPWSDGGTGIDDDAGLSPMDGGTWPGEDGGAAPGDDGGAVPGDDGGDDGGAVPGDDGGAVPGDDGGDDGGAVPGDDGGDDGGALPDTGPPDRDGDGVPDADDACPDHPGIAAPTPCGCTRVYHFVSQRGTHATTSGVAQPAHWADAPQALLPDGAFAYVYPLDAGQASDQLVVDGFGFALPALAQVVGVELSLVRQAATGLYDQEIVLRIPGGTSSLNRAEAGAWGGAWETHVYGGPADTWLSGGAVTPAKANDASFGIGITVRSGLASGTGTTLARVDDVLLTVHYCE